MKVYEKINKVQAALAKDGVTKSRKNVSQGYSFRGIDDVLNALSPLLAEHGLCILPRVLSRICEERQTKAGTTMFYVTVEVEFDFVASEDGSKHTVKTYGEAMDSGDKATNKAMSAAMKYACIQAFSIPTEGDHEGDLVTPMEVIPKPTSALDEKTTGDFMYLIANAEDLTVLQNTFKKAYTAAIKVNDQHSINTFTKIKDKRKEELREVAV
jgi:hypothetical protein